MAQAEQTKTAKELVSEASEMERAYFSATRKAADAIHAEFADLQNALHKAAGEDEDKSDQFSALAFLIESPVGSSSVYEQYYSSRDLSSAQSELERVQKLVKMALGIESES